MGTHSHWYNFETGMIHGTRPVSKYLGGITNMLMELKIFA